jgi:hypothetical protein
MTQPTFDDLEEVRQVLGAYFNADMGDGAEVLKADAARVPPPPYVGMFRRGLERVLRDDLLGAEELQDLTHRAFDSDEQARAFLLGIWDEVFG